MTDQLKPLSKEERASLLNVRPNDKAENQEEYQAWIIDQLRRALLTIEALEFKISKAEPGSAGAIVHTLFDLAESECGHNPASARHGLTTIRKWITDAKARINELEQDRDRWQKQAEEWDQYTDELEEKRGKLEARQKKLVEALQNLAYHEARISPPPYGHSCCWCGDCVQRAKDDAKEALREIGEGEKG